MTNYDDYVVDELVETNKLLKQHLMLEISKQSKDTVLKVVLDDAHKNIKEMELICAKNEIIL